MALLRRVLGDIAEEGFKKASGPGELESCAIMAEQADWVAKHMERELSAFYGALVRAGWVKA